MHLLSEFTYNYSPSMTKYSISCVLILYFFTALLAVIVRFDEFPWTWVPMYSTYETRDIVSVPHRDRADLLSGLMVNHSDGSKSRVTAKMLNIPLRNYWRIYLQRVNHEGPLKYPQARMNLSPINQFIWRGQRDVNILDPVSWDRRVLVSLNRSFGYSPGDSKFIIQVAAPATHYIVNKDTMNIETRRIFPIIYWNDKWNETWPAID